MNDASKEEILTIPGIGERMADYLLSLRNQRELTLELVKDIPNLGQRQLQFMDFSPTKDVVEEEDLNITKEFQDNLKDVMKVIQTQEDKVQKEFRTFGKMGFPPVKQKQMKSCLDR